MSSFNVTQTILNSLVDYALKGVGVVALQTVNALQNEISKQLQQKDSPEPEQQPAPVSDLVEHLESKN